MAGGDVQRGAGADEGEDFLRGLDGQADATVGAGEGFDEPPVHAVGGLEFHPVGHGVSSTGAADAAAVHFLGVDGEVALRSGGGCGADGTRRGEQDAVSFHDIDALGSGAQFDGDVGRIGRLLDDGIVGGGEFAVGFADVGAVGGTKRQDRDGGELEEAGEGEFHDGDGNSMIWGIHKYFPAWRMGFPDGSDASPFASRKFDCAKFLKWHFNLAKIPSSDRP